LIQTTSLVRALSLGFASACLLMGPRASACGVSASGISSCSLEEHNEAVRPRWAAGVSGLFTSTKLRFSGLPHAAQVRYASLATLAYLPTSKLMLQVGAGAAFGGSLTLPDGKHAFSPGPTAAIGLDYHAWDDRRFFLLLTSSLSFTTARTQLAAEPSVAYTAFDLRVGVQAGVQLANIFRPYAVARAFGGPVYWRYQNEAVTGTDLYHYQVGAGLAVSLTNLLSLFAEGVPLGERALSLGAGFAF
jgi:hypothetical protein